MEKIMKIIAFNEKFKDYMKIWENTEVGVTGSGDRYADLKKLSDKLKSLVSNE